MQSKSTPMNTVPLQRKNPPRRAKTEGIKRAVETAMTISQPSNAHRGTKKRKKAKQQPASKTSMEDLRKMEERDREDLLEHAAIAEVINFDESTGRPIFPSYGTSKTPNEDAGRQRELLSGLLKLPKLPCKLMDQLFLVHDTIIERVGGIDLRSGSSISATTATKPVSAKSSAVVGTASRMVPWAGLGQDSTRLRAFGLESLEDWQYLTGDTSGIRLYAQDLDGEASVDRIMADEEANLAAACLLPQKVATVAQSATQDLAQQLVLNADTATPSAKAEETKQGDREGAFNLAQQLSPYRHRNQSSSSKDSSSSQRDLVVYQPNLHNGARHLQSHLDWPLHEGFGRFIITVSMRGGGATVLLFGIVDDEDDVEQAVWKFRVEQGEAYVLSGAVRNRCLHAILADQPNRESLNLRLGLHTPQEVHDTIYSCLPKDWVYPRPAGLPGPPLRHLQHETLQE